MYAIILTGGKQVKVQPGDTIFIEKLAANEGDVVTFDKVLLVGGDQLQVGAPFLANASVTGKVVKQGKSAKIVVFRYKRKSDIRIKKGHRQPFTSVTIEAINV
jgi:large subunit ribosomal protein L21